MYEKPISREFAQKIAKVRHEMTNYDRLSAFYAHFKAERHRLNGIIGSYLCKALTYTQFRDEIKKIERAVDLNHHKPRKIFLRRFRSKIMTSGYYTLGQANAMARNALTIAIKLQQLINAGEYRPDVFDTINQEYKKSLK